MTKFKDFDEKKILNYSDDELRIFLNEIEMKRSELNVECAEKMSVHLKNDEFDMYSRSGERVIKRIAGEYAKLLSGADAYENIIRGELKKREQFNEEKRYSGKSIVTRPTESDEEFLQKEQDKTWAYRSKIE